MSAWNELQWSRLRKFTDCILATWPNLAETDPETQGADAFDPSSLRAFSGTIEIGKEEGSTDPAKAEAVEGPEPPGETAETDSVHVPEASAPARPETPAPLPSSDQPEPSATERTSSPESVEEVIPDSVPDRSANPPEPEVTVPDDVPVATGSSEEVPDRTIHHELEHRGPSPASAPRSSDWSKTAAGDFFSTVGWDGTALPGTKTSESTQDPSTPVDQDPASDPEPFENPFPTIAVKAAERHEAVPATHLDSDLPAATYFNQVNWSGVPAAARSEDPRAELTGTSISIQPRAQVDADSVPAERNPLSIGAGQAIRASRREAGAGRQDHPATDLQASAADFFTAIRWTGDVSPDNDR